MQPSGFKISDREYWKDQFRLQELSGLTQVDYCKREGVKLDTFKYAKGRLSSRSKDPLPKKLLVPIKSAAMPQQPQQYLSIITFKGTKIECPVDTNPEWLGSLLAKINA
ncbi:MAG: hypothetical protein NT027_00035 [Proteobacteria bacterium]|nr:hypothetical protein [Pseudomonadota bacterium]